MVLVGHHWSNQQNYYDFKFKHGIKFPISVHLELLPGVYTWTT